MSAPARLSSMFIGNLAVHPSDDYWTYLVVDAVERSLYLAQAPTDTPTFDDDQDTKFRFLVEAELSDMQADALIREVQPYAELLLPEAGVTTFEGQVVTPEKVHARRTIAVALNRVASPSSPRFPAVQAARVVRPAVGSQ